MAYLFEILYNTCIMIICCPVYDVINFEIYLSFLIKPFLYIIKKQKVKIKILMHLPPFFLYVFSMLFTYLFYYLTSLSDFSRIYLSITFLFDCTIVQRYISLGTRMQFQNGTNVLSCKKWKHIWPFLFNLLIQDTHISSDICHPKTWKLFGRKFQIIRNLVIRSYITLT